MTDPYQISPNYEKEITRAIAKEFYQQFASLVESDVIVIGAGPAGLVCGKELASRGLKVLLIEQSNHLGGGFWSGGYLMNKSTVAAPAHEILEKIGVPCKKVTRDMYVVDAPYACSKLIGSAFDAGIKVLNLTVLRDLIIRGEKNVVEGVVVNYAPVYAMPHGTAHVDPIGLECKIVVDATGHDAIAVQLLSKRGLCQNVPGNGAMWVSQSEALVLEKTGEIYPNLFLVGLSVAAVYGSPRMGPAFGSMLLSGKKGADLIARKLKVS
ncbi:MAG: thiazole biosynthesis protein [Nitrospirae bacterium]|nr:thiazole biosynthesis protein [Nitrospirota bacterium]